MPLLALKGISKKFGDHMVLDGISLEIERGEVVAIVGRSGSGKSTLLRCINGLEIADAGTIAFDGRTFQSTRRQLKELRRETGMVFQSYNLFPHLNVERNITLGMTAGQGRPLAEAKRLAKESLELVGLEDKIDA
jgi:polar amino acid transport system ATP-binding protein